MSWCAGSISPSCRGRRPGSIRTSCACSTRSYCTCCPSAQWRSGSTAMGVGGGEAFWEAVRSNLAVLADAKLWWQVVNGPIEPVMIDAALCGQAAGLLPPEPWDEEDLGAACVGAIKQATGAKGKALFAPLASGADRPRARPGAQAAPAADRPRPRACAARRQDGLSVRTGARMARWRSRRRFALGDRRLRGRRRAAVRLGRSAEAGGAAGGASAAGGGAGGCCSWGTATGGAASVAA